MNNLNELRAWANLQEPKIPEKALLDWWCSNDKQYHCIWCENHGNHSHFLTEVEGHPILCCGQCKEYKGLEPCIPGYCLCGE